MNGRAGRWAVIAWWSSIGIAALAVVVAAAAHAEVPRRLWVLQPPDAIVAFDLATFTPQRTVKVAPRLVEHPEYVSVNAAGQLMFLPPKTAEWGGGEMAAAGGRAWLWDGRQAREWRIATPPARGSSAGKPTTTETARQPFLSAAGDSLIWLENTFVTVIAESSTAPSVRTSARVVRSDLAGGTPRTIVTLPAAASCACATGVCSETCPEWSFWAPDGVVDDVFVLTRVTPGQLEVTYHESVLYERTGSAWQARKLPQALEAPLAAAPRGERLVAAIRDAGCCGWANESNDQTVLVGNGPVSLLYDETRRFDNRNYDVSFYSVDAQFAPGGAMIAHTLVSTATVPPDLRLSSDGKDNAAELARIRAALAELPTVEIVQAGPPPRVVATIHRAGLVAFLDDRELLVAQDGRLVVYGVDGGKRKETPIRVRSAADAFLR